MKRTILILGGGVMQLPAVRAARRLGLAVVVADVNSRAPAVAEADEFLQVDLKDHLRMTEAALEIRSRRGLDAVFTAGTDFSATVAYVAERLGLPGTRYEAALDATDKFRMRRVLREAGVSVPDFAVVTKDELRRVGCASVRASVSLPVVVKPVDSMGARGVVRADTWDDADRFARAAVDFSRSGRVVVEGFIDGPEFSLDAIVYGDDVQITGFADRHIMFPPYFIETGHTLPTSADPAVRDAVVQEFRRAIRALGIGPGAAKGDVKFSAAGPVIGEVAARLSGGYMSGWTYPLATGVPLTEIGIRVALGDVPPRARPVWDRTSAERAVISIPGRLARVEGVADAERQEHVEEVFLLRERGDRLSFPRNNVEKVANVIAAAEEREVAITAAAGAVRVIVPVLEPRNPDTDAFLFADEPTAALRGIEYLNQAFPDLAGGARAQDGSIAGAWARALARPRRQKLVVKLPRSLVSAHGRDWAYRSVDEVVTMLRADGRVEVSIAGAASDAGELDALLHRAIVKGGLQGARYVVDSLTTDSLPSG